MEMESRSSAQVIWLLEHGTPPCGHTRNYNEHLTDDSNLIIVAIAHAMVMAMILPFSVLSSVYIFIVPFDLKSRTQELVDSWTGTE